MLLTKQQEYILNVLHRLGCIRMDQLTMVVYNKFSTPTLEGAERIVQASLRQLRSCHSTLRVEDNIACFTNRGLNMDLLEAITIMLELGGCAVFDFNAETSPILLRFVVDRPKLAAFAVVKNEHKPIPPKFYPAEKVIILLRREERPQLFPVQNPLTVPTFAILSALTGKPPLQVNMPAASSAICRTEPSACAPTPSTTPMPLSPLETRSS